MRPQTDTCSLVKVYGSLPKRPQLCAYAAVIAPLPRTVALFTHARDRIASASAQILYHEVVWRLGMEWRASRSSPNQPFARVLTCLVGPISAYGLFPRPDAVHSPGLIIAAVVLVAGSGRHEHDEKRTCLCGPRKGSAVAFWQKR